MSIDIVLSDGQIGYDVVADYVRKWWCKNRICTAIVMLETSYDGKEYLNSNDVVTPDFSFPADDVGVEFLHDWWEGEKYIKIYGLIDIHDIKPGADVVEVVRCKDCRWCEVTNWDGEILYGCDCCGGMNDIAPDYYCNYGERKEK